MRMESCLQICTFRVPTPIPRDWHAARYGLSRKTLSSRGVSLPSTTLGPAVQMYTCWSTGSTVPRAPLLHKPAQGPLLEAEMPIPLASRTQAGIERLAQAILEEGGGLTTYKGALTRVATSVFGDPARHPVRGVLCPRTRQLSHGQLGSGGQAPLVFAFSGNGSQWAGMASELLQHVPLFRRAVQKCADVLLTRYRIDLMSEFESSSGFSQAVQASLGLTAVQIGLIEVLRQFGIEPDMFLGHSAGDVACGYMDGGLTLEQTMAVACERALKSSAAGQGGLMASVGLSAEAAQNLLRSLGACGTVVACDNSPTNVTISGPEAEVRRVMEALSGDSVFVREVESRGLAYHSPMLDSQLPQLHQALSNIIPEPVARSERWISSCYDQPTTSSEAATVSADYHARGYRHACLFRQACQAIPAGAVVVEVGPHNILRSLIRQNQADVVQAVQVPLMQRGQNSLHSLLQGLGELWKLGYDVKWPSPTTDSEVGTLPARMPRRLKEALVGWDHRSTMPVPMRVPTKSSAYTRTFDLAGREAFICDHVVDGQIIIPATAYVVSVWEAVAASKGVPPEQLPVILRTST
eukprot:jgi/Botrbrau1/12564/Bobra.0169s0099.1